MKKVTGLHTFHVNAQAPVSSRSVPAPSQKPTFHTISSNSFREEATKVKSHTSANGQSPLPTQSHYGDSIRFATPKTTNRFTHRQEKNTLPPKKRLRTSKYPKDSSIATLSGRKPVNTALPTDAWALILKSCDIKFLIGARLVCSAFHEILSKDFIWKEVREKTYPHHPPCPPGISEMQYANLISERGCQIRPCTRGNTRKIYWPFMLRMCDQCFHLKTQTNETTSPEAVNYDRMYRLQAPGMTIDIPTSLAGLLPCAAFDSGRYVGVRSLRAGRWADALTISTTSKFCFLSSQYEDLKCEFSEAMKAADFNFHAWAKRKWDATYEIMEVASYLEVHHDRLVSTSITQADLRREKIKFFTQKALELDPPMHRTVLEKMLAYHGAIETNNRASLRSWDVLRSKIDHLELRNQAERLLRWDWEVADPFDPRRSNNVWSRLASHREARLVQPRQYKEEQEVVVQIARQQFEHLIDTVHDEDVVLLMLDAIRRTYESLEEKPIGLNGDGSRDTYQLTMDDARMVIEDVLEISSLRGTMRERTIFGSLKCIACWRPDHNKYFDFDELIRHVRRTHCKFVGIDLHFHRIAAPLDVVPTHRPFLDPVPWYHIPWPKSFPALPRHRKVESGMSWNPDEEVDYVRHPDEVGSIFEDRIVSNESKIEASDLSANFRHAITTMIGTRLEVSAMVRIALEYVAQRAARGCDDLLRTSRVRFSVQNFKQIGETIHEISPTLKFRFLCGLCMKASKHDCHARFIRYPVALDKLVEHWEDKHDIELDSPVQDVLHLPSESELRQLLKEEDTKLKLEKDRLLAKATDDLQRLDPRVQALLKMPSCMDGFTQLFPLNPAVA